MKKGGLLLSDNTVMLFDNMTEEEGMRFLRHILNYHKTGKEPGEGTERLLLISFKVFKADYDVSQEKYKDKVKRMEAINERKKANSYDNVTTSHDNVTTFEKSSPNTSHNNTITLHNNSKETDAKKDVLSLSPSPSSKYHGFLNWLNDKCPHLLTMAIPTETEFNKLLSKVGSDIELKSLLIQMDNRKDTAKKNYSIYRTALNWWNRDHKKE